MRTVYVNSNNLQEITKSAPNVSMALGFFDGIHLGHKKVIQTAKKKALENNLLTAVLSFAQHPKSILFAENVMYLEPIEQKIEKFEKLGVDIFYIVDFNKELAKLPHEQFLDQYIVALNAKEIVCGFDYTYGYKAMGNVQTLADYANNHSIGFTVVEELKWNNQKISSTLIRDYIKKSKLKEIPHILGDFYKTKYCQKNGILPQYTLPNKGDYKVLIDNQIECVATVRCDKYIQIHHETSKLPNLLTIQWLDQLEPLNVK